MTDTPTAVGIDLGGTKTRFVVVDGAHATGPTLTLPTPAREGGEAMMRTIVEGVEELIRTAGAPVAVGIGTAGVVDHRSGRIVAASDSFTDWAGTELGRHLATKLGLPVSVDNDVNAFLFGELTAGAVTAVPDVFGISVGTGVGGALAIDGDLHRGRHGAAGEIGHVPGFGDEPCTCGQYGHLESLASGRSIARRYRARAGTSDETTAADVTTRAADGDPAALAVLAEAGDAIGRAALIVAGLLDVGDVVVGGGVSAAWDLLAPSVRRTVTDSAPVSGHPVRIHRARLGADAAAVGAAALALRDSRASADP
ncbi:glucokinase [Haloactinopolyspora alba]|uniref:Glucokinase n=1 Tax=Haloactinopolyspora alba TaxID=648780 RepID=A0A2P8DYG1_9ACTN|nr:ROK family protein [Haloactinopolyspora alba]PSL02207.1 glucokinase [Haloactinopolyspora alba]